jgi:carboxypeptidase Taq
MGSAMERLKERLGEIHDLNCAESVLSWDQQVNMPPGGGEQRAQHLSTLNRLIHSKFTSEETLKVLDEAEPETASLPEDHDDRCLIRVARRDYERARKLPTDFVAAWTRDGALSAEVWRKARKANDYAAFQPHLAKMAEYARKAADYYGYEKHAYDALLDGFEQGLTVEQVQSVFSVLRTEQVALAKAIAEKPKPRADFLHRDYLEALQEKFGLQVSEAFGYDLERGRLDIAPHPFETSFGRNDVRITTRYKRDDVKQSLFAIWHETGHALYEQNISPSLARTPLSGGVSNVFHESQSRLWENVVARSRPFWQHYFPLIQQTFPDALSDVTAEEFYRAINTVEPSLIRVEADEVTYNLHIMLRFDLELALIEGSANVSELPELWAAKMQEYLGVTPPDDRDGVMQDVHWSGGSFGYFPTYALGNVMGAQIFETALKAQPDIEAEIGQGQFSKLKEWLTDNIYKKGRKFTPQELVIQVNGQPMDARPYIAYLKRKYQDLYDL